MPKVPTEASKEELPLTADAAKSHADETDLLIKLDPEEPELSEMDSDDVSKLNITSDSIDAKEMEDQKATEEQPGESDNIIKSDGAEAKNDSEESNTLQAKAKFNYIWVSNITRNIKATDLKKLFVQIGKVSAVKILTNGQNFYGYVSMENAESAAKCVTDLNNSIFQGEKITVSRNRPDLGQKGSEIDKKKADKAKKTKNEKQKSVKPKAKDEDKPTKDDNKDVDNPTKSATRDEKSVVEDQEKEIRKLQSRIDAIYATNIKLKTRFEDVQRLYNGLIIKYNSLKNELKAIKLDNRDERRRLDLDKDNFEKMKRLELSRLDNERSSLSRELSETKKLKESLKLRIEEIKFPKRGRSPVERVKRRPSPMSRGSGAVYRGDQRSDKKFRRSDVYNRDRTPPPPNLNSDIGKRPGSETVSSGRAAYFSDGIKPPGVGGFDYRQNHMFQPPHPSQKGGWIPQYPKEQRRGNDNPNQGNNFANVRYSGPSASHQSSVAAPPRGGANTHYYQQW